MCTCTHKKANILLQGQERHALTVEAISGNHRQIRALLCHYFTSYGFTWSAKSTLEK